MRSFLSSGEANFLTLRRRNTVNQSLNRSAGPPGCDTFLAGALVIPHTIEYNVGGIVRDYSHNHYRDSIFDSHSYFPPDPERY